MGLLSQALSGVPMRRSPVLSVPDHEQSPDATFSPAPQAQKPRTPCTTPPASRYSNGQAEDAILPIAASSGKQRWFPVRYSPRERGEVEVTRTDVSHRSCASLSRRSRADRVPRAVRLLPTVGDRRLRNVVDQGRSAIPESHRRIRPVAARRADWVDSL